VRWLWRLALAAGVALTATLGMLAAAVVWLDSEPGLRFVTSRGVAAANGYLIGALELGRAEGHLLSEFTLRQIALRDGQGVEVAGMDSLSVAWHPGALLDGRLDVERVRIQGLRGDLAMGPEGLNLLQLFPPGQDKEPKGESDFEVAIRGFEIDGGISYDPDGVGESPPHALTDLQTSGSVTVVGGRVSLALDQLATHVTNPDVGPVSLAGTAVIDGGTLPQADLTLHALGAELVVAGEVGAFSDPDLDIVAALHDLELDALEPIAALPLAGATAAELHARGRLDALHLTGEIDLPQGDIGLDLRSDLRARPLTYGGAIDLREVDLSSFLTVGPGMPGGPTQGLPSQLNGRVDLAGKGTGPDEIEGHVELALEASEILGYGADELRVDASLRPGLQVEVGRLRYRGAMGEANLRGWSDIDEARFGVTGSLASIQLAEVGKQAGVDLGGWAGGDLQAAGGWGAPSGFWVEGSATVHASDLVAPSTEVAQLTTQVQGGYGAAGPRGTVTGEAHAVVAGGMAMELASFHVALDRSSAAGTLGVMVHDQLRLDLDAGFDWSRARSRARVNALSIQAWDSGWALTRPCAVTLLGGGAVHIDEFDLLGEQGHLNVAGTLDTSGESSLSVRAEEFQLATVRPLLGDKGQALAGGLELTLDLQGAADSPNVSLQVRGQGVRFHRYGPFSLDVGVVVAGGLTNVVVAAGGPDIEPLNLQGIVPFKVALDGAGWEPHGILHLYADIPLQDTGNLSGVIPQVASLPPSRFGVTVTAAGSGHAPTLKTDVRLRDIQIAQLPTISVDVDGHLSEGRFDVATKMRDVRTELLGANLVGEFDLGRLLDERLAGVPATGVNHLGSAQLDVDLIGLPVETLRLYTDAARPLHGKLTGLIKLDGSLRSPRVSVDLGLRGGRLGEVALKRFDLDASVVHGTMEAALDVEAREGGVLDIDVSSPIDLGLAEPRTPEERFGLASLDGSITGEDLPLGLVTAFIDGVSDSLGTMRLEGSMRGTLLDPDPDARLMIEGGGACMASLDVCFEDIEAEARASRRMVMLRQLRMTSLPRQDVRAARKKKDDGGFGGGWLLASGSVGLGGEAGLGETSIDVEAEDFWVSYNRQLKLRTALDLQLRGIYPDLVLRGDVVVPMLKVEMGDELKRTAWPIERDPHLHIHRQGATESAEEVRQGGSALMERLDAEVRVVLERNCWIYLDMSTLPGFGQIRPDIQLEGDLGLLMRNGTFISRGEVRTVRGSLTVLSRKFKVDEGVLTFTGASPPDPQLDVKATHASRFGDIVVHVEGRSSSPALQFTSEEMDNDADILSVLMFGAPAEELLPGQGASAEAELAVVTSMLAARANQALGKLLGHSAVDMISLETNPAGPGSFGIEIGKAITDRIFLITRYRRGVPEDENQFEGQLELALTRKLYIELRYGDAGNGGIEVFMKWRR